MSAQRSIEKNKYIELGICLGKMKRKVVYLETGEHRPKVGDAVNIKGEGAEWEVCSVKVLGS